MSNKASATCVAEITSILAGRYQDAIPAAVARSLGDAVRLARYAKRRSEIECTYDVPERSINRARRRIEREAERITSALHHALGISGPDASGKPRFEFGGDPRGTCGQVFIPGVRGDAWGGDGFPLY